MQGCIMTSHRSAGSDQVPETYTLEPVQGPTGKPPAGHFEPKALGLASFTTTYQWRGNGTVRLNLVNGWIGAGSRVFGAISEYNTAWNVDRFIGNAPMQVLNVAPYNGGAWVEISVNWGGPINVCVSLLVDP